MASAYQLEIPKHFVLTSSGLTTATTAYTSGDQLGAQMSLQLGAQGDSGTGYESTIVEIKDLWVTDRADVLGAVDIYLFNASVTPAADNAAVSFSDADIEKLCSPVIQLTTNTDLGLNKTTGAAAWWERTVVLPAGVLYVCMVTKSGHSFFGATSDVKLNLIIEPEY